MVEMQAGGCAPAPGSVIVLAGSAATAVAVGARVGGCASGVAVAEAACGWPQAHIWPGTRDRQAVTGTESVHDLGWLAGQDSNIAGLEDQKGPAKRRSRNPAGGPAPTASRDPRRAFHGDGRE